jgi:hypothetical protein
MTYFLAFSVSVLAVIALTMWYTRLRAQDRMAAILATRGDAMIASAAQLIDGANHIPVALSLDVLTISYTNADLDASIDVQQIDEVEYGSDLVTGGIAHGAVLRLRSHGRAFEFVLDSAAAARWSHRLPPHRMNEGGSVHVV